MERPDNYLLQTRQAKRTFLTYDQDVLIRKLRLEADRDHLYIPMLRETYRLDRHTGDLSRNHRGQWLDANSHPEVMTLLDLVCDCREDRHLARRWKNMNAFGLMFHQELLEGADPWAAYFQEHAPAFRAACIALGGIALAVGDIAYAIELFDGLPVAVQLWLGDEEFPPNLRFLWDENALMYIRYETMYFAKALLLSRLREEMESSQ